jgi:hypothetical protein
MTPDLDPTQVDEPTLAAGIFALVMCGLTFFVGGAAFGALAIWFVR